MKFGGGMVESVAPLVLLLAFIIKDLTCIKLTELRIPGHTVREQSAFLECHYELEGESLYSVKWYKDGHEFYRFVPRENPPIQIFQVPGVNVNLQNSTENTLFLTSLNLSSTGKYRCEISGEGPSFQTVTEHGLMQVVALPEEGPRITGGKTRYQIGETVRVNCTSGRSKPAAQLTWYINGDSAPAHYLRGPYTVVTGREGLETSILGLDFQVRPKHFKRGDMKLKCLATIATIYWNSNEESVEGDRPQKAPVSEIVRSPPNSHAVRISALNGCSSGTYCIRWLEICGLVSGYVFHRHVTHDILTRHR